MLLSRCQVELRKEPDHRVHSLVGLKAADKHSVAFCQLVLHFGERVEVEKVLAGTAIKLKPEDQFVS